MSLFDGEKADSGAVACSRLSESRTHASIQQTTARPILLLLLIPQTGIYARRTTPHLRHFPGLPPEVHTHPSLLICVPVSSLLTLSCAETQSTSPSRSKTQKQAATASASNSSAEHTTPKKPRPICPLPQPPLHPPHPHPPPHHHPRPHPPTLQPRSPSPPIPSPPSGLLNPKRTNASTTPLVSSFPLSAKTSHKHEERHG